MPDGQQPNVRGPEGSTDAIAHAEGGLGALWDALAEFDRLFPGLLGAVTSTVMHEDRLLSRHGAAALFESSPGRGVMVMPVRPEEAEPFLATFE